MTEYLYIWYWRKRLMERRQQPCRIVARGKRNSVLVEFKDGSRVVTSRYAVRRRPVWRWSIARDAQRKPTALHYFKDQTRASQ